MRNLSRTRLLLLTLFLTMNCASSQVPPIAVPPEPPTILLVPRDLEDEQIVCVERPFGGPSGVHYDCLTIDELRSLVRTFQRADNN